ncbi:MFS transporter [Candidatus Vallotia cooleyia]|uniref:MFS transporter n=1 Tax=Candidatus Vallotiella adelgis TaxID=1177211 RepID=UPI001D00564C|nr:MFS transporter [Candidatus Vallotia cooleyia]UDG82455.1 putative MFS-type transporter YcaD [Candidatus Vallotia cooleyia]
MKVIFTRDFFALIAIVAVLGLGIGATLPLTALALMQAGYGSHVVGMLTGAQAIGGIAIVPFAARIVSRIGARHIIISMVCITSISTLAMQLTVNLVVWALLRAIAGAALMLLFTITETWMHQLANDRSRGRIVALYTTNFTLFQMTGPLLVSVIADYPEWRFALCGAIFLLALPGLWIIRITRDMGPADQELYSAWKTVLPCMPSLVVGAGFFALFDTLALSLLPLFAIHHGVATELAVLFGSAILLGDTLCAFSLGWLADRIGRKRVHLGAAIVVTLLLPTLPVIAAQPWLCWPVLIVLGAAAGGVYTLSLAAIGERFCGAALVTASSLIGASWGMASCCGPIITGTLMRVFGPDALVGVLLTGVIMFIFAHLWEQHAAKSSTHG